MMFKDKMKLLKILIYFHKLELKSTAVENNLIKTEYLGTVKSIDLANKIEIGLTKLFEALSITNKIPMSVGQQIKQYSFVVSDRRPSPGEKG